MDSYDNARTDREMLERFRPVTDARTVTRADVDQWAMEAERFEPTPQQEMDWNIHNDHVDDWIFD